ncbi:MAG: CDGSH-type Zn-finger protein, partial [Myxococcota bacterium]
MKQELNMSDAMNIFVIPDGPIKISGAEGVSFCGEAQEVSGDVYLCRCGDSSRAPFCDGTHKSAGFSGACEKAPDGNVQVWEGQTLRTFFNADACMHVYYCKPLKALRAREEGGDAEAAAEIMRVIGTCPSGALSYEVKTDIPEPAASGAERAIE